jgi:hypothetical protein
MLVPKASELTSSYSYTLPNTVTNDADGQKHYKLNLYKQAGMPAEPVDIALTIPPGARIISTQPEADRQEDETVHFNLLLNGDQTIIVTYK